MVFPLNIAVLGWGVPRIAKNIFWIPICAAKANFCLVQWPAIFDFLTTEVFWKRKAKLSEFLVTDDSNGPDIPLPRPYENKFIID
jgi:hypothetical protein